LGDIQNGDRAGLTSNVAVMFSAGGYKEAADQMVAEAEALAGQLGDPALLGQVLGLKTVHLYFCGQPRAAVEAGLRSAEILRSAGATWGCWSSRSPTPGTATARCVSTRSKHPG